MRNCPECEREMYHWQCACGFRTPKPSLVATPKALPSGQHCPDCERFMVGDACRCGYRRPGTPAVLPQQPPAKLSDEQRQRGRESISALKDFLQR